MSSSDHDGRAHWLLHYAKAGMHCFTKVYREQGTVYLTALRARR